MKNKKNDEAYAGLIESIITASEMMRISVLIWIKAMDRIILNEYGFLLMGQIPEAYLESMTTFIEHMVHNDTKHKFQRLLSDSLGFDNEVIRINHPKRKKCYVQLSCHDASDEDIFIMTLMDITNQITEKKRALEELNFLQTLIETIPHPIFYKNKEGIYRYFNQAFLNYLGKTKAEVLNKSVYDIASKELADVYRKADNDLMAAQEKQIYEGKVAYADGSIRDVLFTKAVQLDVTGESAGIVGIMEDVTERNVIRDQLKLMNAVKEVFLEMNHKIIDIHDEKDFMHEIMLKFAQLLGVDIIPILLEIKEGNLVLYDDNGINVNLDTESPLEGSFINYVIKDNAKTSYIFSDLSNVQFPSDDPGAQYVEHLNIGSFTVVPISSDECLKWIFTFSSTQVNYFDFKDMELLNFIRDEMETLIRIFHLHKKTLILSRYDGLTGLMNRGYFDKTLEQILDEGTFEAFKLVIFDLDKFKFVNDTYGHNIGDVFLQTFSELIREHFSEEDYISRIGGDEFAGIIVSSEILEEALENLRKVYESKVVELTNGTFNGTFSYGISRYPDDGDSYKSLLKAADKRMYLYKKGSD